MMRIYLAGPINQASDAEAKDWRKHAAEALPEWEVVDPMVRDYRGREDANVEAIVENDKADVLSVNLVLANCPKPSAGTSMEILLAYENSIRVVTVAPEPVSPWVRYHSERVFQDLDAALEYIKG